MINLDRKFRSFIYLSFFISLILSYLLNENSSGGASLDKIITKPFIDSFSLGFLEGINYSINVRQIHSPIFYYVLFLMDNFFTNETSVILYIFISSLIPFIFYKILKKKFKKKNKNFLFLLSLIIFLSPYFRSSAVWITNDNLALLFFCSSIYLFIKGKYELDNKFINYLYSFFLLVLASYIRQHYALFIIIYFLQCYRDLKLNKVLYILGFCILLSIPALKYYILYFESNFEYSRITPNYRFNFLIFLSIFIFYIFPIFLSKNNIRKIIFFVNERKIFLIFLLLLFNAIYINFNLPQIEFGGGIIYKFFLIIDNNFIFFLIFVLSLILFLFYSSSINDFLVLTILFLSNPFPIIYQKYFDPVLLIIFFGLMTSNLIKNQMINKSLNIKFIYIYYSLFLFSANYYYSN